MKINILTVILSILCLISCQHQASKLQIYPEAPAISDINGIPQDSVTPYFPYYINVDSKKVFTEIDTFLNSMNSVVMFALQEKVLYNYYLGHNQYRFTWFRSFNPPVTFTMHRKGDNVWLHIKMLERYPHLGNEMYTYFDSASNQHVFTDSVLSSTKFRGNIVMDETIKLSLHDWDTFENLLQETGYWSMAPSEDSFGMDGSRWIVEAHLKDRYWFVDRWSPDNNFSRIGRYLVYRSGIKVDFY
ncbi:hypothetical protein [Pontibacter chinhatensis]|uniref:Lipoprotein n=1 Tax=Pontibacter chinhatensis TaxID=1436961 RepID=A0A1I2M3I9_9BACT|nr:hypothetical protein [Pontibacter chinhatensis]SFF85398.1 hypothetical protein SAMN05421739_101124 [Pontibacter chinhatensis]